MIKMKFVSIWDTTTGKRTLLKSGDRETWKKLSSEEKYWVRYLSTLQNQEMYSKVKKIERTLTTNNRKYIPVYIRVEDK